MDFQKKINENYQIILILIISLIIFSTFSLTSKVKYWDETVYANLGYDLSRNISGYSFENTGYSDFVPCGESSQYCWPNAGFRPPLLPFVFSILYITNLSFLIPFFIPVISTLNLLLVYLLGRRLFSKSTGIYAAIITSLVPIYYFFSGKMLNDILISFFITLSALFFWLGYEQNKSKYKILLGLTLALGLLAKYTMLWFFPALLIYLIFRKKLIKTLLDKSFWLSIVVFFLILIPWMFYSFITYRNPIGSIIHGLKAASYWGGFSSWNFFFIHSFEFFSVIGIVFLISLIYYFINGDFRRKEIYFILIILAIFFVTLIMMPHKEDRFILPIVSFGVLIVSSFLNRLKSNLTKVIIVSIIILMSFTLAQSIYSNYKTNSNEKAICFLEATNYLKHYYHNSLIITEESSPIYYYTKLRTHFFPSPWSMEKISEWSAELGKGDYVVLFSFVNTAETNKTLAEQIMKDLEEKANKTFSCTLGEEFYSTYSIDIK